ncbi:TBC1 domain family member 24-like [Hydractinia symbiolongicarpus]|uniref:TBC1 domain family member 24-like n=1 Tax=Hydractinia symbiolongicarpus TaxID=13093 RepID=UPI002551B366|nr:TBC1 domain family member 24-like [Hydractinia symbiolongicarpus]
MAENLFQVHVKSSAVTDLEQSELFTSVNLLNQKETEFVKSVSSKATSDLTAKEAQKLKEIARKHVEPTVRAQLWLLLSGGADVKKKTPSLYTETYEELFTNDDFVPDGMDDNREFLTYYLTPEGGHKLRQVMCVVNHLNPDITFCPLMEPVISLFLHFMNAEDCFACVSGLLMNKTMPFLAQTKFDNVIADATLQDLFKQVYKQGYARLSSFVQNQSENPNNKLVLFPLWRRMIFEKLNFVCLVRILDCLIVEGSKSLFRVGLFLLDAFYEYSLAFRKLDCSSPPDLLATVGQYATALKLSSDYLLKTSMKINITTKQIEKFNKDNGVLHKEGRLEYKKEMAVSQVVAVDLNQVSDIIKPDQWQHVCQWLPTRIQIQQPFLLFSTNKDGYNLKTLYLLCEDEEQTLIIIQTTKKEIFGAYLSRSLLERHDGRSNMSYFGTGETFLFKLSPSTTCYHWGKASKKEETQAKSKYVFVDTTPDPVKVKEESDGNPTKSRRKSLKRTFSRQASKSARVVRNDAQPLTLINIKRNAKSVPRYLFLGKSIDLLDHSDNKNEAYDRKLSADRVNLSAKRKPLKSAETYDESVKRQLSRGENVIEDVNGEDVFESNDNSAAESSVKNNKRILTKGSNVEETFDVIDEDVPMSVVEKKVNFQMGGETTDTGTIELFISCDNSRLIVGGGGGEGLSIDGEIQKGRSSRCDTFQNEPLSSEENGDFIVARLDVFGFR